MYYPRAAGQIETIDWSANADWDNFTVEPVTLSTPQTNTITLTGANGIGTAVGSAMGDGNDRRLYVLEDFRAKDMEVALSYNPSVVGTGQVGLALRKQNQRAVVIWTNVLFGFTAQLLNGIWVWNGTGGIVTTNQGSDELQLDTEAITTSGNGTTVTVQSRRPHKLAVGDPVGCDGINAAFSNFESVSAVPDAISFQFLDSTLGPFSGGVFRYVASPARTIMRARLINNVLQYKQYLNTENEPPWGDPLRSITRILPATLSDGSAPPVEYGEVGILINHLGSTVTVDVSNFEAISLD